MGPLTQVFGLHKGFSGVRIRACGLTPLPPNGNVTCQEREGCGLPVAHGIFTKLVNSPFSFFSPYKAPGLHRGGWGRKFKTPVPVFIHWA